MGARILIVEDDESIGELLRYNLEAAGFEVALSLRGDEAELLIQERTPDLLILDWLLPGLSGIELCRRIRAKTRFSTIPILMLTARGEEGDRIRGLSTGADDYIIKPFSVAELVARVKAALRRAHPELISGLLRVGDLELDKETHRVFRGERELKLGPTEYRLLEFFMLSPGRVYSREQLLNGVWGESNYVDERTVDVHVGRLRKAIVRGREVDPIRTVRGAGYALDDRALGVTQKRSRRNLDSSKNEEPSEEPMDQVLDPSS
jgi:two-component system, OmpR family, phosphate regulon response regulator PhoB